MQYLVPISQALLKMKNVKLFVNIQMFKALVIFHEGMGFDYDVISERICQRVVDRRCRRVSWMSCRHTITYVKVVAQVQDT